MEEYICNTIGPRIRGDGGWVEFVSYEDRCLTAENVQNASF
mgnify:CR=1 FL=1